ncbi:type II toxin-antitoxin system VapC family toxin [Mesorhizobium sp. BAC0120]|uniref:type II toxin-antitoxin system VapC family toxin n=1 Tax=Mesorhizobium sp. BAC0120 TaxID=3090670 RepID=UPI00298C797A|nr:type II toxin-antitoxin system VapC family toxin [Mesorhizobium sp. BAC0120]MDW6020503.1 type II toxin-antitoxin system VapC family toxin [Mesorhizobium sp. BAC0120]
MFVDSSAIVAIISEESDAAALAQRLQVTKGCVTSPLVILESAMRLSSKQKAEPEHMLEAIQQLMVEAEIDIMVLDATHALLAVQAFAIYGKGRGHPAQLNLADCLSYACAKSRGLPILYKGNDFAQTDLASSPG